MPNHMDVLLNLMDTCQLVQGEDGIYSAALPDELTQQEERVLREKVAEQPVTDYLQAVAKSHSIAVMDVEIKRFLKRLPRDAFILDLGGGWGWHWRLLAKLRPDVRVIIVDFVRANLLHAKMLLGPLVNTQVALLHADATHLPFQLAGSMFKGFDGVWSVQVLQHIPDFERVCQEVKRVLKNDGWFFNYSLNSTPLNKFLYRLMRKPYHFQGMMKGLYYLRRAGVEQNSDVSKIFGSNVKTRHTECLFHPDLRVTFTGKEKSFGGKLDSKLAGMQWIARWVGRQQSFEVQKLS
jgi:ubiquinone/menaquinone biosynthesis C-methylase UbiE